MPGDRVRGGGAVRGRAELSHLRQQHPQRDRRTTLEEDLLRFLLRQSPLAEPVVGQMATLALGTPTRDALLRAILTAHVPGTSMPGTAAILNALDDDTRVLAEALLADDAPPPLDRAKVPTALRTMLLSLERLAQSERLREQGALLDQVDGETARALLGPTKDLVASRNELTRQLLEEQASYHLR
jgi:hypothetical protein